MYQQHIMPYYRSYQPHVGRNQRFFPFFGLPFLAGGLAGLAISPFFFNRPFYGPYYPPYPPYPPYGYGPPPAYSPYGPNYQGSPNPVTENINIYPQR